MAVLPRIIGAPRPRPGSVRTILPGMVPCPPGPGNSAVQLVDPTVHGQTVVRGAVGVDPGPADPAVLHLEDAEARDDGAVGVVRDRLEVDDVPDHGARHRLLPVRRATRPDALHRPPVIVGAAPAAVGAQ